ncbi:MAG TPA: hypothetical protein VJB97_03040 [Candidatus Paceibacterota bacterium]
MAKKRSKKNLLVGFVGQGYVGGSYANNFEKRGFQVVRYSLEPQYVANKDQIKKCDIVFVCVPTPTSPEGFDLSIVEEGVSLVGAGKTAVIKSTLLPGSTKRLQKKFPRVTVLCSPEFLSVVTAQEDADHPFSNIIGIPNEAAREAAEIVLRVLPAAAFSQICTSDEAEVVKYAHNLSGYTQILTFNLMYDIAKHLGADWDTINKAIYADPLIPNRYSNPLHKSGRGAGGPCFIKDMAAFSRLYGEEVGRPAGAAYLRAAEEHNIALLSESSKDLDIMHDVYGEHMKPRTSKTPKRK